MPSGLNPYAAGRRRYLGPGNAPNRGPTANMAGYVARDKQAEVRREAQNRAQAEMYRRFSRKV